MASYVQGYREDRFQIAVNRNFHCPICMNVLKEPVQCRQNQHYFCTPCISKHLQENSQTCPMCMDKLTLETLGKPPRIVMDYLSSLRISCDYFERGCSEVVELGVLKTHVADCSFSPVVCSNDRCMTIVNKKDQEHHKTKVCEFRVVRCPDCEEEMSHKKYKKHGCLLSKEVDKLKNDVLEMKEQFAQMRGTQEEVLKEIRSVMAEVKVMMGTEQTVTCPNSFERRGDIVVLGGFKDARWLGLNSVEKFNWDKWSWTSLAPMLQGRASATSACYKSKIIVAGGWTVGGITDHVEVMMFDQKQGRWVDFPVKLPYKCNGHKSVVHNDHLLVVGGDKLKGICTNAIHEVLLKPPYTSKFRSRLPQPISYHGLELFNDKIIIIGGTTNGSTKKVVDKVWLYDIDNHECKEMVPLPFAMCDMATVKWGGDAILMGGFNVNEEALNTVFMYNYKEGWCKRLPSMKHKRGESAAVVSGNAIVVVGGYNEEQGCLNSVEYFTFENYAWQELPPMIERRNKPTAVVKPVNSV